VIVDQLKKALACDDADMLRIVVERIGLAIDRCRGDGQGTAAVRQAMFHRERCSPIARGCAHVELGRLAELADLATAGQLKAPLSIDVIPKDETPHVPAGSAGRLIP